MRDVHYGLLWKLFNKDRFGLELDIRVPDEEISFLDSDLWPEFVEGMNCNMTGCSSRSFNSINTLWKHWLKVHRGNIPLFKCSTCSFKAGDCNLVNKHARSTHKVSLDKTDIEVVVVENNNYIPLNGALCPKKRSKLDETRREEAAKERHYRPVLGGVKVSGSIVNRDDYLRMVLSNIKGNSIFKFKCTSKPLWKPKKKQ